jgi:hypothetical protein
MKLGDAFRWGTPPKVKVRHLFFVISDPAQHGGTFVVVNITQDHIRAGRDCVLQIGDHPWITGESFVTFRDARLITPPEETHLISLFGTEVLVEAPLDPIVLKRIIEAAKTSRSLAPVYKRYL